MHRQRRWWEDALELFLEQEPTLGAVSPRIRPVAGAALLPPVMVVTTLAQPVRDGFGQCRANGGGG